MICFSEVRCLVDVEHLSPAMKQLEYPKTFTHRLCTLRQELIDAFIE